VDTSKRIIAAAQLLLLLPACVFMASLGMRVLGMPQSEPAQQIVTWYSLRMWTLCVLLIALPLAALVIGCAALLRSWNEDAEMRQAEP
jgi:heme/copper-type cytochrome/quinol oxidase subunit 2